MSLFLFLFLIILQQFATSLSTAAVLLCCWIKRYRKALTDSLGWEGGIDAPIRSVVVLFDLGVMKWAARSQSGHPVADVTGINRVLSC